jgi:hypothetical protein
MGDEPEGQARRPLVGSIMAAKGLSQKGSPVRILLPQGRSADPDCQAGATATSREAKRSHSTDTLGLSRGNHPADQRILERLDGLLPLGGYTQHVRGRRPVASTEVEATSLETMETGHDTLARACFAGCPALPGRARRDGHQPVAYGRKSCGPHRLEQQLLVGSGTVHPHRVLPPPNAHSSTNRRMRTRMSGGVRGRMGNPSSLLDWPGRGDYTCRRDALSGDP